MHCVLTKLNVVVIESSEQSKFELIAKNGVSQMCVDSSLCGSLASACQIYVSHNSDLENVKSTVRL